MYFRMKTFRFSTKRPLQVHSIRQYAAVRKFMTLSDTGDGDTTTAVVIKRGGEAKPTKVNSRSVLAGKTIGTR